MVKKNNRKELDPLTKAQVLSQALPYMRQYSEKIIVIKYGGHAMVNEHLASIFATDVVLLKQVGIHPIIVHGGGPQIGDALKKKNIKSTFINGLRVTDKATVKIVEKVLCKDINKEITNSIRAAGGQAIGLSGKEKNIIKARKLRISISNRKGSESKNFDLGFVGKPSNINRRFLKKLISSNKIPVIAPIGLDENQDTYNINADTAAGAIASALGATRFLLLTDVAGVIGPKGNLVENIKSSAAKKLISKGTITGGMIPKIQTCLDAVKGNVEASVILDGRVPHAILLELFTEHGVGTLIS
ncbi:MAG: Acetylglutamate kinase [Alphaproteobacteria bacterium MarineAlpha3_Bin7]|nr:MAG: Acetylglutamate kinase [Alphaproteobacteria bacterium MarineAlpha3_Bin7]